MEPETWAKKMKKNRFYIYYLRRPDKPDPLDPEKGQPFYVGKGCNHRYKSHRKEAKGLLHKPGRKEYRISIIHMLWKQRLDFYEDIFLDGLTEQEAFDIEREAIEVYGRKDNGTGILANLTDGGEGNSGRSLESRKKTSNTLKGRPKTKETNKKNSESHIGKSPWNKGLKGSQIPWNKGLKGIQEPWNKGLTKEDHPAIAAYVEKLKGRIRVFTEQWKENLSKGHMGKSPKTKSGR